VCEKDLNERGPTAATFCLLGTIRRAAGEARAAEDCFQRALYLDPNNYEALVQLALSADQRGDQSAATQLRRRAERAAARASER
jgi:chemotaxis protein methyltransferase WspC